MSWAGPARTAVGAAAASLAAACSHTVSLQRACMAAAHST
jgi:hypothetical protein